MWSLVVVGAVGTVVAVVEVVVVVSVYWPGVLGVFVLCVKFVWYQIKVPAKTALCQN